MNTIIVSIAAKNIHKSLAAWCLKSYCAEKGYLNLEIVETNINVPINEIINKICNCAPDTAAFSCYIWNIEYVKKIGEILKKLLPSVQIILGGPEVSFEEDLQNYSFADYIIKGAGEEAFYNLLAEIESGKAQRGVYNGCNHDFNSYPTPYTEEYFRSFENNRLPVSNMLVYYESSRGCPFSCAYCLSSAGEGVLYSDCEKVKSDLIFLTYKGAKCIKFVDRTFNSNKKRAKQILEFILNMDTDCTFHFEAAADLFDAGTLALIEKMPDGRVQFEIGIQSVNEKTLTAVGRKTDTSAALANIAKLASFKNCRIHVDLIAGLPEETLITFTEGIDKCIAAKPDILQLGFLKILKGTRLSREYDGIVYAGFPPYEVYSTPKMSRADISVLKEIECVIDKFYNSGHFKSSIDFAFNKLFASPFSLFKKLSEFCPDVYNLNVSMKSLYTLLLDFLSLHGGGKEASHYIKLDCLSLNGKGLLPDSIIPMRDKDAENLYKMRTGRKNANIRIEYFELDSSYKVFDYDNKTVSDLQ